MGRFNRLELLRLRVHPALVDAAGNIIESYPGEDYVAPIVDSQSPAVMVLRDHLVGGGTPSVAIPYEIVAPPSRHWLGEPNPDWTVDEGIVFITADGDTYNAPMPDGLRAIMTFTDRSVRWTVLTWPTPLVHPEYEQIYREYRVFEFEREQYEAEIASLPSKVALDWDKDLPLNQEWWAATGD